jgi:hypothetical protein
MQAYKPSGRVPIVGLILFIVVGVLLGTLVGVVAYLISTVIFLLILSPLILAVVSGALAYLCVRWGKIRNPAVGFIIGLLLGVAVIGAYWGAGYAAALNEVAAERTSKGNDLTSQINNLLSARSTVDRVVLRETGQTGLIGYVLFMAKDGMTFTRTSSPSSTGITLNREMTLVYWGIELLLVVVSAAFSGMRSAQKPFCEIGKRWLRDGDYKLIGTVDARLSDQFLQALRSGDYRSAGRHIMLGNTPGLVQVKVVKCGEPDLVSPGEMILRATRAAGNRVNELIIGTISPMDYRMLIESGQRL